MAINLKTDEEKKAYIKGMLSGYLKDKNKGEIARLAGISPATLRAWANGCKPKSKDKWRKLCEIIGANPYGLFDDEPEYKDNSFCTKKEAFDMFGVDEQTIAIMVQKGTLHLVGKEQLITVSELKERIKEAEKKGCKLTELEYQSPEEKEEAELNARLKDFEARA